MRRGYRVIRDCDVLSLLNGFNTWAEYRHRRVSKLLRSHGIKFDAMLDGRKQIEIEKALQTSGARVLLNECWIAKPEVIASLASKFPGVQFVNLSHAGPSNFVPHIGYEEKHLEFMLMAAQFPNVWYGTVMDSMVRPPQAKVIELPNTLENPFIDPPRRDHSMPLRLSIVARACVWKNWPAMIQGIEIVARRIPVIVGIGTPDPDPVEPFRRQLELAGASTWRIPWGDWRTYQGMIAHGVDIGIQVSLAESFNSVAAEHMLLGKPVVGSSVITYLPKTWQADTGDPGDIARVILNHSHNLDAKAEIAQDIARELARRNERTFVKNLTKLLQIP